MNKDDMNDDAEFDAFLNGEGDLARRLQGLAQPGPSAALDAAILAHARAAMAQDARPAAANDSGDGTLAPRSATALGWRWRIPAGIAATVLVGVFAQQNFKQSGDLNEVVTPVAPAAPVAQVAEIAAPVEESGPAAAAAAPPADKRVAPKALQKPAAPAKEDIAEPAPAVEAEARAEMADMQRQAMTEKKSKVEKSVADAFQAREQAAPPPPPPAPAPAPVVSYAPAPQEKVQISARRNRVEPAANSGVIGGMVASPAPAPVAPVAAREWLERIEKLLEQGRQDEAVKEWKAFRAAYPGYPVPGTTRERLE